VILGHLGDAYLAAGRKVEAATAFRRALRDLKPQGGPARGEGVLDAEARVEPVRAEIPRFETERAPERAEPLRADPPDRFPEAGDARVRDEIEAKLRALTRSP
jgi:hypothetical protein